eukprot:4584802-Prymnesium_polylepis.1
MRVRCAELVQVGRVALAVHRRQEEALASCGVAEQNGPRAAVPRLAGRQRGGGGIGTRHDGTRRGVEREDDVSRVDRVDDAGAAAAREEHPILLDGLQLR